MLQKDRPRTTVCPVCGIDLLQDEVDERAEDYFCPYCTTQTMPVRT